MLSLPIANATLASSRDLFLHLVLELVDYLCLGLDLLRLETHMRMTAHVQHERCLSGYQVYVVVILELCKG